MAINKRLIRTNDESGPTVPSSFNTVLYSGNSSSSHSITGVGFQPDLVWIKNRSANAAHWITDSVRGAGKGLQGQSTDAELTSLPELMSSFNSDGFTVGYISNPTTNLSGNNYVAWCWKAGGAAVTNTDGTITSQVSANTEAGFSIVSYTGNGTSGATIGHGLAAQPEMIIVKPRSISDNWNVYHSGNTSAPETEVLYMNITNATQDNASMWNDTLPSSSVFTVGNNGGQNGNGTTFIAYCFAEVAGFSKFGSYTGNGLPLGPTIDCGFEPAFIMVKRTSNTADWIMLDNKRNVTNPKDKYLFANSSAAEGTSTRANFLSNGFEVITTGANMNFLGDNYIYMAFANQF